MTGPDDAHQRLRELLGAHALGHPLDAIDSTALRAHLDGCAACRAELDEIAPLREALADVDAARLASPASPPPGLGADIRDAVAAERSARAADELARRRDDRLRRRDRRVQWLGAAAMVTVLVGTGGVLLGRATVPEPPAVPYEAVALDVVDPDVTVEEAGLVPHTWGVELRFRGAGFEEGAVYRAAFVDADGTRTPAGEFLGTGAEEMVCNLQSALLRDAATAVVVTDDSGETVLSAAL
ncbi:anti-sigma factor [uncultured Nocardioides sp.]|uniref:anti-sigma factor n=1 Tax=uncultured Nocardioides sp. TaxID=198441 RepID=UPI00262743E0|nr:anti-sigma factor [uncultured Nocardioides sp.]